MKFLLPLTLIVLISAGARAQAYPQPRPTTAGDYDRSLEKASLASNTAFPFQFVVATDYYENRNIAILDRLYSDRQAQGVERQQRTLTTVNDGKVLRSYSIMVGFGNNTYCSKDRVTLDRPAEVRMPRPRRFQFGTYIFSQKARVRRIHRYGWRVLWGNCKGLSQVRHLPRA